MQDRREKGRTPPDAHEPPQLLNNAGSTSQSQTRDSRYTHETQRIVAHISSSPFSCPLCTGPLEWSELHPGQASCPTCGPTPLGLGSPPRAMDVHMEVVSEQRTVVGPSPIQTGEIRAVEGKPQKTRGHHFGRKGTLMCIHCRTAGKKCVFDETRPDIACERCFRLDKTCGKKGTPNDVRGQRKKPSNTPAPPTPAGPPRETFNPTTGNLFEWVMNETGFDAESCLARLVNDATIHTGRSLFSLLNMQDRDASIEHDPMDSVPEEWNPSDPCGLSSDPCGLSSDPCGLSWDSERESPDPAPSASQTLTQPLFRSSQTRSTQDSRVSPYQGDQGVVSPQLLISTAPRLCFAGRQASNVRITVLPDPTSLPSENQELSNDGSDIMDWENYPYPTDWQSSD